MRDLLCPKCETPLRARIEEIVHAPIYVDEHGPWYSTFDGDVEESNALEVFCPGCGWETSWERAKQEGVPEPVTA